VTLLLLGGGLVTVALIYLGGALVGLAVAERSFRRLTRGGGPAPRRSVSWRWLVREGLAIGVLSMLFVVLLQFDTVLVGLLTGDDGEVGYFGAAHRLIEATMFLVWYVGSAVMPWVARADDGDSGHLARGYELGLTAITALLVPMAVVFSVLADPLVRLLYGDDFGPAALPLQLLSAMTVLYGINYMTTTFFIGRDRPGAFGLVVAGVVVQNVAFNVVTIPHYGAAGAAFNAVLSAVLMAGLGIWRARTVVGPVRPLRPFVTPLLAGAAMALAMTATAQLPVVSLVVGGLVYLGSLVLVERILFPVAFGEWRDRVAGAVRRA
jgi:O-antigen/teichoic acid export membrane protein